MAHIDDGKGGRSGNVDVNIVPFIDLMSVLIIFLLISAVWVQISTIQIGSSLYGKQNDASPPEPESEKKEQIFLRLEVKERGYLVFLGDKKTVIPKKFNQFDIKKLITELKKIKALHPSKKDAFISMAENLPYNEFIEGMNALLISDFPEISVTTSLLGEK